MHDDLGRAWANARGSAAVVHLDSAAAGRTSIAVQAAVARHVAREAEVGGYVAQAEATGQVAGLRADLAGLTGFAADEVILSHSAGDAMALLLTSLVLPERPRAGCLPSDYQRTVGTLRHLGAEVVWLPVDGHGRLDLEALPGWLAAHRPALVVLCALASQRGIVQPVEVATALCREAGALVVVDAAQALGPVDLGALRADALVGTSRKWLAGPRGVGLLCLRAEVAVAPAPPWLRPEEAPAATRAQAAEPPEAHIAGRVGLAVAVAEHLAAGPERVRERLRWLGRQTRERLTGAGGWTVVEPLDEPGPITTLRPPGGVEVVATVARLLRDHGIVVTAAGPERALADDGLPVLRVSPHLDAEEAQLDLLAEALGG